MAAKLNTEGAEKPTFVGTINMKHFKEIRKGIKKKKMVWPEKKRTPSRFCLL
jgi:hypothetical protein